MSSFVGTDASQRQAERALGSLGWMAQPSVLPRKRRHIAGVSAHTMVDLKATLFEREGRRARGGRARGAGVAPRDMRLRMVSRGVTWTHTHTHIYMQ